MRETDFEAVARCKQHRRKPRTSVSGLWLLMISCCEVIIMEYDWNMIGNGSRLRVRFRRSTDGLWVSPTTVLPWSGNVLVMGFHDLWINFSLHFRLDTGAIIWWLFILKTWPLHQHLLSGGGEVRTLWSRRGAAFCVRKIAIAVVDRLTRKSSIMP